MSPLVHKFGGIALANAESMRRAARIAIQYQANGIAIVASAMGGVTDALLEIGLRSSRGERDAAERAIVALRERHLTAATDLAAGQPLLETLRRTIDDELDDLATIADALAAAPGPLSAAATDRIIARGERLSARLLTAALSASGAAAEYVDAADVMHANGRYGDAVPDIARTGSAVRERLLPRLKRRIIPVVPGFIARGPDGAIVTLGRGGSDLTATLLATALGASSVTLWKHVPGVLTADPRVVPDARLLPRVHVREAAELAYYGARVLHPRALLGLGEEIPLFIRPLADPDAPGTEISTRRDHADEKRHPVRAITAIGSQAIITISGDGMVGVPGIAARAFGALERAGISVSLISQASSEHSICLAVPSDLAQEAEAALRVAFAERLAQGEVEGIDVRPAAAILAVVGLGMAGTIGVAARLFDAIAGTKTSVIAIAQGASELNISVVVDERDAAAVQRAVHAAFRLDKIGGGADISSTKADVIILGFGRIGRELAAQLGKAAGRGSQGVRVVAVIDSGGYVFDPRGLSPRRIASLTGR